MHLNVYLLVVVLHMYFYFQLKENKDKENTLLAFSSFKSIQRLNASVKIEQIAKQFRL